MKMASSPSKVMASVALSSNTSALSRVKSTLSSAPLGGSACLDRASGLPICLPGLWVRTKSNLERYRHHHAWQQFSLWASEIGQVLMIHVDLELLVGPLKEVPPLL